MSLKDLVGKKVSKEVKFMDSKVTIYKLTVDEVMDLQSQIKSVDEDSEDCGFEILKYVIQQALPEASDLSDEDLRSFPIDELSKLSAEIMKYSGMGEQGK